MVTVTVHVRTIPASTLISVVPTLIACTSFPSLSTSAIFLFELVHTGRCLGSCNNVRADNIHLYACLKMLHLVLVFLMELWLVLL